MAKILKVKTFAISTAEDESRLEEFLSNITVEFVVGYDSKILVIYKE